MSITKIVRDWFEPVRNTKDLAELIFDISRDPRTFMFASLRRRQSATRLLRWNIKTNTGSRDEFVRDMVRTMVTLQCFINDLPYRDEELGRALRELGAIHLQARYQPWYEGWQSDLRETRWRLEQL